MLFKISVSNIRKSLKDYAIYFFTLMIGVSIFYVFNAIGSQAAYLQVSSDTREIIGLLEDLLSGVSGFVSVVLGLLIVFASRFLMKRRNKEFALYLILGMGKGKISAILLIETLLIGIGSLFVGLIIGIGLSQVMSAVVASLFEADMTGYRFSVSTDSILKTILYFSIMYVVVMLFNSVIISKCKLIDLMQSGKKSEKMHLKSPIFCTIIFFLAAFALGYAYYQVAYNQKMLSDQLAGNRLIKMIILGSIATFFIFWSVSGLLLRIAMSAKSLYFRGLNCFTFRQISSKVNTTVMSMSVICLMLFVTICTLSGAFSIRNSMNANLTELCPADACIDYYYSPAWEPDEEPEESADIVAFYQKYGLDITEDFEEYVHLQMYHTNELTAADFFEDQLESLRQQYKYLEYDTMEDIVKLSDYNRLMELYGRETLELGADEYILLCNFQSMADLRNITLADGQDITVFGHTLHSKYTECQEGFVEISSQHINTGIFVVPDAAVSDAKAWMDYFIGNYTAESKEEIEAVEERVLERYQTVWERVREDETSGFGMTVNTRLDIAEATIGLGALIALLGLYIGLVFLISSGVMLALKELSDSADSVQRYTMLRKIGAEEREISRSLFCQTGIFFLLPLALACVHSVFGMKFAMIFLEVFGTEKLTESVLFTSVMILLIYGGYFLITYFSGKSIIREQK